MNRFDVLRHIVINLPKDYLSEKLKRWFFDGKVYGIHIDEIDEGIYRIIFYIEMVDDVKFDISYYIQTESHEIMEYLANMDDELKFDLFEELPFSIDDFEFNIELDDVSVYVGDIQLC